MTRKDKARRILEILDGLYPTVDIPLDHADPFTLLVAVVLSAQTTDKLVNQVTPDLFARASTPERMAALPVEEIQHLIRRIGLTASKAKNLKRLAEILVAEHGGRVPRTFAELEALPGVGHKTASVVLNQAVTLGPCAIAHGNLSITISSTPVISQPAPLSQGQTVGAQQSDIRINQEPGNIIQMPPSPQLADVVKALNSLGATPGDLLAILQAIKAAGALNAELEVI